MFVSRPTQLRMKLIHWTQKCTLFAKKPFAVGDNFVIILNRSAKFFHLMTRLIRNHMQTYIANKKQNSTK